MKWRAGVGADVTSFKANGQAQLEALQVTLAALRRAKAMPHRLEAKQARHDTREWVVKRRERTRHLIELGGLVVKANLVELTDDDRAFLYGAFRAVAIKLQGDNREQALTLWRRGGKRAFASEAEAKTADVASG